MSHLRTRIKFCGITSVEDAHAAVAAGADAIGLVFHPASPRHVSEDTAATIAATVPAFVTVTGLFVNPDPVLVTNIMDSVRLDLLQFHGDESPEFCRQFGKPYMKAFRVGENLAGLGAMLGEYRDAVALLVDAWHADLAGGSGSRFDWNILESVNGADIRSRLVLAGGLDPHNAAEAIRVVKPYALDVSSGIETAPGRKSRELMQAFYQAVRQADAGLQQ